MRSFYLLLCALVIPPGCTVNLTLESSSASSSGRGDVSQAEGAEETTSNDAALPEIPAAVLP